MKKKIDKKVTKREMVKRGTKKPEPMPVMIPLNILEYFQDCKSLPLKERTEIYNKMTDVLKDMVALNHPVLAVKLVSLLKLHSNTYNPNKVAPPEMKLLELSMAKDGVTMPVVAAKNDQGRYVIIDGFHRTQVISLYPPVSDSLQGYVPVVELNKDIDDRIASTVRHNMARGTHKTSLSARLVGLLKKHNWHDERIAKELGMEADEVLRLKQLTGLAEAFQNEDFSQAWE